MHPMVSRLAELLPPPLTPVEPRSWEEVQAGPEAVLPRDFRDFVDTYGYGVLDDVLSVLPVRGLPAEAEGEFRTFRGVVRFPAWPADGALLGWGTTPVGHDLFWRRSGDDPDAWPVVVVERRAGTAVEPGCCMAEFVVRMLGDRLDRPADISAIPGHPHSRYLNTRDAAALEDAGEDPWEYLDVFWDARDDERAAGPAVPWVEGPGRHRADNPPVPRLTVRGFGMDGADLRVSATLDLEPGAQVTASVRIGGPNGDVLRRAGVPTAVSGGAGGQFALDIRLSEAMNDSGRTSSTP